MKNDYRLKALLSAILLCVTTILGLQLKAQGLYSYELPQNSEDPCVLDTNFLFSLLDTVNFNYDYSKTTDLVDVLNRLEINASDLTTLCVPQLSTGPLDCTAALELNPTSIRILYQDFDLQSMISLDFTAEVISFFESDVPGLDSTWVLGNYLQQGELISGMEEGLHALHILATDSSLNFNALLFFEVKDLVLPVVQCPDELSVTLSEENLLLQRPVFARLELDDFNDRSWDNCNLAEIDIRRKIEPFSCVTEDYVRRYGENYRTQFIDPTGYSAWGNMVEFYCGDISAPVEVELRGIDLNGNERICITAVEVIGNEDCQASRVISGNLVLESVQDTFYQNDPINCTGGTAFKLKLGDLCTQTATSLEIKIDGQIENDLDSIIIDDTLVINIFTDRSLGMHLIEVNMDDGCDNALRICNTFEVIDTIGPKPNCIDTLAVDIQTIAPMEFAASVLATDLIAGDIGDCSAFPTTELVMVNDMAALPKVLNSAYSVYFEDSISSDPDWQYVNPLQDSSHNKLSITCEQLQLQDTTFIPVRLYAVDSLGNYDYCTSIIHVRDDEVYCPRPLPNLIRGQIRTEDNNPILGIEVQLSGDIQQVYFTGADGSFSFCCYEENGSFNIQPKLNVKHTNGLTTLDLIIIRKHILGVELLSSPYKVLAADLNNSEAISTLDLILLRKLILNILIENEDNASWRFVDANHIFEAPFNPWSQTFPEQISVRDYDVDTSSYDFIGIKTGDVNGSANLESRNKKGILYLNTKDQWLEKDQVYTLDFDADLTNIEGFQFTLSLKDAEILDLVEGALKKEHFGLFKEKGILSSSFDGVAEGNLFSLVIKAKTNTSLGEILSLNSRYTASEAYTKDSEELDLLLQFNKEKQPIKNIQIHSSPNPFTRNTLISFNLPKASKGQLFITDVSGRMVKRLSKNFNKGRNEISIQSADLAGTGLYFYTLELEHFQKTQKLLLLD